ncbi:peroxiredoxin family protein [Pedobacter fastidiosus]|uniref:Redoxin domain-containing protein n=1 Tax=Pedobacter fastidiosus TaxID=2765361 RepID=A0ABR7KVQ2_9SPHI|nr:redoxin domain-containing protein [Pedobacter fastidiosus]MBC6111773.1 redoxin domain-containing protein [Pedobacter fastidiosus]
MKNKLILVLGLIALGLGCLLAYKIAKKYPHNKEMALQKQTLPNFQLYSQNLKPFSAKQLKENEAICIFYYNAECEHCQYEATQINKQLTLFKNVQIVMISTNKPQETANFAKTYKLDKAGLIWLYDKDYAFYKWFGKSVTPSVYIYNAEHKLVKEYTGEVKIEAVIKYLDNGKEG